MVKNVKDVVSHRKSDIPPGAAEVKLRMKHVPEAIEYNHGHAFDHLEENADKIKKMRQINPEKAKQLARECIAEMKKIELKIKKAGGI
jgi:hypothetical protein